MRLMKTNRKSKVIRWLALVLALCMALPGGPVLRWSGLAARAAESVTFEDAPPPDDMAIGGVEPAGQAASIARVADPINSGADSLFVSERAEHYSGAAWYNIPGDYFTEPGYWKFTSYVRAESADVSLLYNLELHYSGGAANKYLACGPITAGSGDWTELSATWAISRDYLADLTDVTIYPMTGDGSDWVSNSGSYYIDDVSLEFVAAFDDMSIGGAEPDVQGDATIQRTVAQVHSGNDSLLVTGRGADWHGATWNVASAVTAGGAGDYAFESFVQGVDSQSLGYTVNLADSAWVGVPPVTLSGSAWTRLAGTIGVTEDQVGAVTSAGLATLYPGGSGNGDYYIDDVRLWKISNDDISLLGATPYGQGDGVGFTRTKEFTDPDDDALVVSGRAQPWEGAAWNIPAASLGQLRGDPIWKLSGQARAAAGDMNLTYNLQFWYSENVSDCKYLATTTAITDSAWADLGGTWVIPADYLAESLTRIVVYPTTGDGQLGDYLLDELSLTGLNLDDMAVDGKDYFAHQSDGTLTRTTEQIFEGNDSLKVTGRSLTFGGAAWDVLDLLKEGGDGLWQFTTHVRSAADPMHLSYSVFLQYADGSQDWLFCCGADLTSGGWSELSGLLTSTTGKATDFANLTTATLYPVTGDGQMGDYYLDAVSLVKVGDDMRLNGKDYFNHTGNSTVLSRAEEQIHTGLDALKVTGRVQTFDGAAWDILELLKAGGDGTWSFCAQARAVGTAMNLSYSVHLQYANGTEDWLFCAGADINAAGWTELSGNLVSTKGLALTAASLTAATLYPVTDGNELGDYYLDDVSLVRTGDGSVKPESPPTPPTSYSPPPAKVMPLAGKEYFVHGGNGSCRIARSTELFHSGKDALKVTKRTMTFAGPGWDVLKLLRDGGDGLWRFTAYARSDKEPMRLSYSVYLKYQDGSEDWLFCAGNDIGADGWAALNGTLTSTTGKETDFAKLESAVLYPVTEEGQLGDYYLDDVALVREGERMKSELAVGGKNYFLHGGSGCCLLTPADSEQMYQGTPTLKVSGRTLTFAGAGWDVLELLQSGGDGRWSFSAQARAAGEAMNLSYSVHLKYKDGSEDWLFCAGADIGTDSWVELTGTLASTTGKATNFSNLESATLYPVTGEEQLGDYYLGAVTLKRLGDAEQLSTAYDMTVGGNGYFLHGGEGACTLERTGEQFFDGADALKITSRTLPFAGAGWDVASLLKSGGDGVWEFTARARSVAETMRLSYSIYLKYLDGSEDWLFCTEADISADSWTGLSGRPVSTTGRATDFANLELATLYPLTGEGQLGDYYLDAVTLTRLGDAEPTPATDDMTVGGRSYFFHGGEEACTLERTAEQVYTGADSLKIAGRTLPFAGAGWDVLELLKSDGPGTWEFNARARSDQKAMHLSYSVYLQYADGSENWLFCAGADISARSWGHLSGALYSTTNRPMDFDGLTAAILYPVTEEGQLGDYYLDSVSLKRTGSAIPSMPQAAESGAFVAAPYDYDYFPLDGGFEERLRLGEPGYPFQHSGQGSLERTAAAAHSGKYSLLATGRPLAFSGPGWDVTSYLKNQGWGNWFFSAYVMAVDEPMSMSFSVYLRFDDGSEDWLSPGYSYYVGSEGWSRVNGDYMDGDACLRGASGRYDFGKLEQATLYMNTNDGGLGSFYLDEVSLYRGPDDYKPPVFRFDSFPLDGTFEDPLQLGAPGRLFLHGEGARLERTEGETNNGKASLLVAERKSAYSGAGWVVTDYLKQEGWGDWYFSAFGKSAGGGAIGLSYSIYLKFEDGREEWMNCGRQTYLTAKTWTRLNGDTAGNPGLFRVSSGAQILDFSTLDYAVLYPAADEGMMGDYYLDDVQLWRVEQATGETDTPAPPVTLEPITTDEPQAGSTLPLWAWLSIGGGLLCAGVVIGVVIWRRKNGRSTEQ